MPNGVEKIEAQKKRALDEVMWEMLSAYDDSRPLNHDKIRGFMQTVAAADLVIGHASIEDAKEYAAANPGGARTAQHEDDYDPFGTLNERDERL